MPVDDYHDTAFIGCDPGQSGGGIAYVFRTCYDWSPMPDKPEGIAQVVLDVVDRLAVSRVRILIEQVGPRSGEGIKSVFGFGRNLGRLEAVASLLEPASGIDVEWDLVAPQTWQRPFGLFNLGLNYTDKKRAHLVRAIGLFPAVTVTDTGADALMIAAFCSAYFRDVNIKTVFPHWDRSVF